MLRSGLIGLILSVGAVAGADGQYSRQRGGLWAGVGLGLGSARATCSVCQGRASGPTGHVRVGGTLSQTLLVGGQGSGWFPAGATSDRSLLMVTILSRVYPWQERGLALEAGIGWYRYVEADTVSDIVTEGLAVHLGAGFDLRIARSMSLSPFATLVASGSGNPVRRYRPSGLHEPLLSDMTVRYVQLGIAATLH